MSPVMITGACGFIGCNFVRYVNRVHPEWDIVLVDKLTYAGRKDNLDGCIYHRFVQGDIANYELMEHIITHYGIRSIINFAAESHVDRSIKDSRIFTRSNVVGVHTLVDLAVKYKLERFLQVGTDEVYGTIEEPNLFTEETPLFPKNPYSMGKAAGDLIARAYGHTYGLSTVITRSSNNYGAFQFPEKLIPMTITQALQNKPIYVYGKGESIRDWIYVEDNCKAIDTVFHRGRSGEIYNIGGVYNIHSILEVIRRVLALLGKPDSLIEYVKPRPGEDHRYATSIGKIMTLGWKPEWDFERGLTETIGWYTDNEDWWRKWKGGSGIDLVEWEPGYQKD